MYEIAPQQAVERGILAGLVLPGSSRLQTEDTLNELALLADTAGVEVIDRTTQERRSMDSAYLIGRGKAEELSEMVKAQDANLVIFDDDLSPAQTRNLEPGQSRRAP